MSESPTRINVIEAFNPEFRVLPEGQEDLDNYFASRPTEADSAAFYDARREQINQEQLGPAYEDMSISQLAKALGRAEHYGDKTSTLNVQEVLDTKVEEFRLKMLQETSAYHGYSLRGKAHDFSSDEELKVANLQKRIGIIKEKEKQKFQQGEPSSSSVSPEVEPASEPVASLPEPSSEPEAVSEPVPEASKPIPVQEPTKPEAENKHEMGFGIPELFAYSTVNGQKRLTEMYKNSKDSGALYHWPANKSIAADDRFVRMQVGNDPDYAYVIKGNSIYDIQNKRRIANFGSLDDLPNYISGKPWVIHDDLKLGPFSSIEVNVGVVDEDDEKVKDPVVLWVDHDDYFGRDEKIIEEIEKARRASRATDPVPTPIRATPIKPAPAPIPPKNDAPESNKRRLRSPKDLWYALGASAMAKRDSVRGFYSAEGNKDKSKRRAMGTAIAAVALGYLGIKGLGSLGGGEHHAANHVGHVSHSATGATPNTAKVNTGFNPTVSRSSNAPTVVNHIRGGQIPTDLAPKGGSSIGAGGHNGGTINGVKFSNSADIVNQSSQVMHITEAHNSLWSNVAIGLQHNGIAASNSNIAIVTDHIAHGLGFNGMNDLRLHDLHAGYAFELPPHHVIQQLIEQAKDATIS